MARGARRSGFTLKRKESHAQRNVGDQLVPPVGCSRLGERAGGAANRSHSAGALSEWLTSKTTPRTDKLIEVERLFEVPALRLMKADFGDLLANELSDRERYERVEQKIAGFELSAGAHGGVVLDIQGTGRKKGRARVDKARKSKNG